LFVLQDLRDESFGDDIVQRADDADSYVAGAAGLGLLLGISLAVLLMIWLFRTTKLLRARGHFTRFKPGWAIGGAFIPIAQFVILYRMLSDCRNALAPFNETAMKDRYFSLPWWWGLQTAAILVGQTLGTSDTQNLDSLITEEYLRLGMAAGLLAALVLSAITFDRFRSDFQQLEIFE
jgi:hypothetical protein